jgi:hypothetical protein
VTVQACQCDKLLSVAATAALNCKREKKKKNRLSLLRNLSLFVDVCPDLDEQRYNFAVPKLSSEVQRSAFRLTCSLVSHLQRNHSHLLNPSATQQSLSQSLSLSDNESSATLPLC